MTRPDNYDDEPRDANGNPISMWNLDMSSPENGEKFLLRMPKPGSDVTRWGPNRDAEAARLKAQGYTLLEICDRLGLGTDTRRAAAAIRRALVHVSRFANDEMRILEMNSLDEMEAQAWRTLRRSHPVVSNGRVVHNDDGEMMEDDRFVLEVLDRILKIKERRSKLMGLDAPTHAQVITIDHIDAEIAALEREVQAKGAELPTNPAKALESAPLPEE